MSNYGELITERVPIRGKGLCYVCHLKNDPDNKIVFVQNDNKCVRLGNYIIENVQEGINIYTVSPFKMIKTLAFDNQIEAQTYTRPLYNLSRIDYSHRGMYNFNRVVPGNLVTMNTLPNYYTPSAYDFP